MVSSKSENPQNETLEPPLHPIGSLRACLVDGDSAQRACERRSRRRSLLLSVVVQLIALAALILVPMLSRTERIALANVMPMPPYHHVVAAEPPTPHLPRHSQQTRGFAFCLTCPPNLARTTANHSSTASTAPGSVDIGDDAPGPECPDCNGLVPSSHPQPIEPPRAPNIIHLTHLDPATLIRRVEPLYPILARQTGSEGHVELHAIIAADGSVRALQAVAGDSMFYQSALDAVGQWRYQPTVLNGRAVEVDTTVTVVYKLNR